MKKQHGVVALFHHCAVFPQLARIPCAVFEVIASTISTNTRSDRLVTTEEKMPHVPTITPARVRAWLLKLLDYSLLQGSLDDGIGLHDLVRDYVLEAAGRRSLREMQRRVLAASNT